MPNIVGVVFHKGGKVYDFDAGTLELARGEQVVVETVRGTEVGVVAVPPRAADDADLVIPLKAVLRRATAQDLETLTAHAALRAEALATCRKLISRHGLDMKLVDAEVMFGGGKIIFSFFAEERIDFRALVVDLAKALKMRIELRQIGVRDEARMFGGLGPCGRHLCCTLFQVDQEPVSIRMAKEQNLPLNPMKISGLCGRLMCCLKYEQEQYVAFRREAPRRGTPVTCPRGEGIVAGYQVPKDSIVIKLGDGTFIEEKAELVMPAGSERCCCNGESLSEPASSEAGVEAADTTVAPAEEAPEVVMAAGRGVGTVPGVDATESAEEGPCGVAGAETVEGTEDGAELEVRPAGRGSRRGRKERSGVDGSGVRGKDAEGAAEGALDSRPDGEPGEDGSGPGENEPSAEDGAVAPGQKKKPRRRRRRSKSRKPGGGSGAEGGGTGQAPSSTGG